MGFSFDKLKSMEGFLHIWHLTLAVMIIVGMHLHGVYLDYDNGNGDSRSWSGFAWAIVVGIFGICALGIVIWSLFGEPKKEWCKWYYLAGGVFVMIFAGIGLGLNPAAYNYKNCMKGQGNQEDTIAQGVCRYTYGNMPVQRFFLFCLSVTLSIFYAVSFLKGS